MSPLKITLLMNLYCLPQARDGYPHAQADAPAMREAFDDFIGRGVLLPESTHARFMARDLEAIPFTSKGLDLVRRLKEVAP